MDKAPTENTLPEDLMGGSPDDFNSDADFDSALDDILSGSDMLRESGISTREEREEGNDNADDDDDLVDDESGDEEDDTDGNDSTDDDDDTGDDEDSTEGDDEEEGEDDEDDEGDDVDLEFEVPIKIDGEASKVKLGELVKGYQTSQHLSKKGRELADERKEFESNRDTELTQIQETAKLLAAQTQLRENELAKEYSELQTEYKTAKADGDRHEAADIKDKMEEIQQKYWSERQKREKVATALTKQEETKYQESFQQQVEVFNNEIKDYVPDFNEDKATELREFAISKGIPEEVLQTLIDAKIIGAINEFMELDRKISKGSVKRKEKTKRRPTTTQKAKPASVKTAERRKATSNKIRSGNADEGDMDNALDALVGKYFD